MASKKKKRQRRKKSSEISSPAPTEPNVIAFHYIKGNLFHVVHANGVFGGITPRDEIQMDFFSERWAIPQQILHELRKTGSEEMTIGDEVGRVGKEGIVREVEVGVTMSLESAKSFSDWLAVKIKRLEGQLAAKGKAAKKK